MSTASVALTKEEIELIEELTVMNGSMGLPPAMAKIVSLLTVSEETELTFEQIKDTLQLSKTATSQAINQLLLFKKISYKRKLGGRKRHFHLRLSDWEAIAMEQLQGVAAMVEVCQKVLAIRSDKNEEFNGNLKRLLDFSAFIYDQAVRYKGLRAQKTD